MIRHIKLEKCKFLVYLLNLFIFLSSCKTDVKADVKNENKTNSVSKVIEGSIINQNENTSDFKNGKTNKIYEYKTIRKSHIGTSSKKRKLHNWNKYRVSR